MTKTRSSKSTNDNASHLGDEPTDIFHCDRHERSCGRGTNCTPAIQPVNMTHWSSHDHLREDARWKFGLPSAGNANYAWVQHFIHRLAPRGMVGFVLANGSIKQSFQQSWDSAKSIPA